MKILAYFQVGHIDRVVSNFITGLSKEASLNRKLFDCLNILRMIKKKNVSSTFFPVFLFGTEQRDEAGFEVHSVQQVEISWH